METTASSTLVEIAGCGAVTALGLGLEPLERALRSNAGGLRPCPRFEGAGFQTTVSGWVPDEVWAAMQVGSSAPPDDRAFLLAQTALRQASQTVSNRLPRVAPARRGFVLSTTKGEIAAVERAFRRQPSSSEALRHAHPARLAADLAAEVQANGPVRCVSAACVSGLLAIQQGSSLIRHGHADLVFVVGVDLLSAFVLSGFSSLKSLEPEGCRPFDCARAGLSLGEGAGALVLTARRGDQEESEGRERVRVSGWGTSNDANHLTGPSRDGSGLALAIRRALGQAGLEPADVDYVNLHGTGTPYNDAMEALAIRAVFGGRIPPFSSSKGMLGHTLGAAGVLETILCVTALRSRLIPGTPRLRERDPAMPDALAAMPRPAPGLRRILKVNCGFAGTNSALVLERTGP